MKFDEPEPTGAPDWMMTFSDIMSLLVTFFVLLVTFSTLDPEKFQLAKGAIQGSLGVIREDKGPDKPRIAKCSELRAGRVTKEGTDFPTENEPLTWADNGLAARAMALQSRDCIEVKKLKDRLIIRIHADVLFDPGSVELRPRSIAVLRSIGKVLEFVENPFTVDGHTDSTFIATTTYRTAWALSAARAATVAQHLSSMGYVAPSRMGVCSYGSQSPAYSAATPESRVRNRRVDITVYAIPRRVLRDDVDT